MKRNIIQRTNKAEQDQENRARKRRVVGRIYGIKCSLKGYKDRNRHKKKNFNGVGKLGWFMSET